MKVNEERPKPVADCNRARYIFHLQYEALGRASFKNAMIICIAFAALDFSFCTKKLLKTPDYSHKPHLTSNTVFFENSISKIEQFTEAIE